MKMECSNCMETLINGQEVKIREKKSTQMLFRVLNSSKSEQVNTISHGGAWEIQPPPPK